jgi:hypothetical protein
MPGYNWKGARPGSPNHRGPQPKWFPQIIEAFWQSDLTHLGSTPRHPTNRNPFLATQAAWRTYFLPVAVTPGLNMSRPSAKTTNSYRKHTPSYSIMVPFLNTGQGDDGGSTYLWNVGRQLFYAAVHLRRQIWKLLWFNSLDTVIGPTIGVSTMPWNAITKTRNTKPVWQETTTTVTTQLQSATETSTIRFDDMSARQPATQVQILCNGER